MLGIIGGQLAVNFNDYLVGSGDSHLALVSSSRQITVLDQVVAARADSLLDKGSYSLLGDAFGKLWKIQNNAATMLTQLLPYTQGVEAPGQFTSIGSLYKVNPLVPDAKPLLIGSIPDKPSEPVAWTRLYGAKHARIFNTTLGHAEDFQNPEFRRLLLNGIAWALGK